MRIQHNISALNTHRNLAFNNAQASKNLEKLSSGYKINRAGDDAAGLAISEKMRGQIRGLDMATKNSQDAISLIQTAEGALNETHAILQRMRELSVQSGNDTNVNTDRDAIQQEVKQLTEELDRIATTTEFNTQNLLDGSFSGKFQIGANEKQDMSMNIGSMKAGDLGLNSSVTVKEAGTATNNKDNALLADGTYTIKGTDVLDGKGNTVGQYTSADGTVKVGTKAVLTLAKTGALKDDSKITISDKGANFEVKNAVPSDDIKALSAGDYKISGTNVLKGDQLVGKFDTNKIVLTDGTEISEAQLGFKTSELKAGAEFTVNGVDVSTRDAATGTITAVDKALESVSKQRSQLGAVQNRLEHT
ncbi:MAG TPA: flagellin, partial [Metalysinibacillus sp.]